MPETLKTGKMKTNAERAFCYSYDAASNPSTNASKLPNPESALNMPYHELHWGLWGQNSQWGPPLAP